MIARCDGHNTQHQGYTLMESCGLCRRPVHIRVYCQGCQQTAGRSSRVRGPERAPHLNLKVASHGSNVQHWIGKAIREGKNRHSQDEKRSRTRHIKSPNPGPRGHGYSIRRKKDHTTKQKRTKDWQMNLATMSSQCSICNKKKGNCHLPAHLTPTPSCLEC